MKVRGDGDLPRVVTAGLVEEWLDSAVGQISQRSRLRSVIFCVKIVILKYLYLHFISLVLSESQQVL